MVVECKGPFGFEDHEQAEVSVFSQEMEGCIHMGRDDCPDSRPHFRSATLFQEHLVAIRQTWSSRKASHAKLQKNTSAF